MNKTILLLLVILIPQKSFEIYYSVSFVLGLFFINKDFKISRYSVILFSLVSVLVFFKTIINFGIDDIKEFIKIFFFIYWFEIIKNSNFNFNLFNNFLKIFIYLNLLVIINQIFKINPYLNDLIAKIFISDSQQILLTYDNVRAIGLSPGIGQQGVIFFTISIYFWILYFNNKKKLNLFFLVSSSLILLMSQSKTAFIGYLLFIIIDLIFFRKTKFKNIKISVLVFSIGFMFNQVAIYFKEYNDLIRNLWSSSLDFRIQNWMNFIYPMFENPVNLITGIGRNFFTNIGFKSSVFDNDFIYVLVNFGILGLIFFFLFIKKIVRDNYNYRHFIFCGLVVGIALNFYFEPKSFILILLILKFLKEYERKHLLDFN